MAIALGLLALSLALRLGQLDATMNVDGYQHWQDRIRAFWHALERGDRAATYRTHHPGVTFMWLAGALWKLFGLLDAPLGPLKLALAKIPVVVVGAALAPVIFVLLRRLLGHGHVRGALLAGAIVATEPLLVAASRAMHLDMLQTSLTWCAVLSALVALKELRFVWAGLSGLLLGLAILTKLPAAGFALGIALWTAVLIFTNRSLRLRAVGILATIAASACLTCLVLWPALLVDPPQTVERVLSGLSHEMHKSSPFMYLGQVGRMAVPPSYYGWVVTLLTSPVLWLPALMAGWTLLLRRSPARRLLAALVLCSLPYWIGLFTSERSGPRYLISGLPLLAIASGLTLEHLGWRCRWARRALLWRWAATAGFSLLLVLRVARLVQLYPLPEVYCSGFAGVRCETVFHLGSGEGYREAALWIRDHVAKHQASRKKIRPIRVYAGSYWSVMNVWLPVRHARKLGDAELLIDYINDWQRWRPSSEAIRAYVAEHPGALLHVVRLGGRAYVRIYRGPRFRAR